MTNDKYTYTTDFIFRDITAIRETLAEIVDKIQDEERKELEIELGITFKQYQYLLALVMAFGNKTKAATAVNISLSTAYDWARKEENFRQAFDGLYIGEQVLDVMEDALYKAALQDGNTTALKFLIENKAMSRNYASAKVLGMMKQTAGMLMEAEGTARPQNGFQFIIQNGEHSTELNLDKLDAEVIEPDYTDEDW